MMAGRGKRGGSATICHAMKVLPVWRYCLINRKCLLLFLLYSYGCYSRATVVTIELRTDISVALLLIVLIQQ